MLLCYRPGRELRNSAMIDNLQCIADSERLATMQIAVVSDIHDHIALLRGALDRVRGSDVLICCGDLCSGFIVRELGRGFAGPIHIVFGNNDGDRFRMGQIAVDFPQISFHGDMADLVIGGLRIAVVHYPEIAEPIGLSGRYDLVCYGHNHQYEVRQESKTTLLNPGEVMGELTGNATCATFETASRTIARCDL